MATNYDIILTFYSWVLGLQTLALFIIFGFWHWLPRQFRWLAISSILLLAIGFIICHFYLVELNYECSIPRKLAYVAFYGCFVIFDLYQILKVFAITRPGRITQGVLYFSLLVRTASYGLNIYNIRGRQFGAGSCTTVIDTPFIIQEKISSFLFEGLLLGQIILYIFSSATDDVPITNLLGQILDGEMISFGVYIIAEIVYCALFFSNIAGLSISLLNTFYLNIPLVLFIWNARNLLRLKLIKGRNELSGGTSNQNLNAFGPGSHGQSVGSPFKLTAFVQNVAGGSQLNLLNSKSVKQEKNKSSASVHSRSIRMESDPALVVSTGERFGTTSKTSAAFFPGKEDPRLTQSQGAHPTLSENPF